MTGAPVLYRDMTAEQMMAWGHAESEARQRDLAGVKSQAALDEAKANAKARRRLIGASIAQATRMVIEANRAKRIAEAREVAHG